MTTRSGRPRGRRAPARGTDGALLEGAFQTQVLGLARFYGWLDYHTHNSERSRAGFPDLTLVRGPELIFAELKRDSTYPSPAQRAWIEALAAVPSVEVYVWRPRDWDEIQQRLARGRALVATEFDPRT